MVRSTELLLWAHLLCLAGSQPPLLTMEPPWTPQFKGDPVTLLCGDPNTRISTSWYKNWRRWMDNAPNQLYLTLWDKGRLTFQCRTGGSTLSTALNVTVSDDPLLLQLPVHAVLEGDALSLQCKAQNREISSVSFYHEWKLLQEGHRDQLQLPAATQQHSGRYHCTAYVQSFFSSWSASSQWLMSSYSNLVVQELFSVPELKVEGPQPPPEGSPLPLLCATRRNALRPHVPLQFFFYRDGSVVAGPQSDPQHTVQELLLSHSGSYSCMVQMGDVQKRSPPVTVTVRRVPISGVSLQADPPGAQVLEGSRLVLICAVSEGSGPLSFTWYRQNQTGSLGTGQQFELPMTRMEDSDRYHCMASNGISTANSTGLLVTVVVPVSDASIAVAGLGAVGSELVVMEGEALTLRCSVGSGSGPLGFTWLRDGRELSGGAELELGALDEERGGAYQCVASNGLGAQRVFRAPSPEVTLVVRREREQPREPALAIGLTVPLLLLALISILGWFFWRRRHRGDPPMVGNRGRPPGDSHCVPPPLTAAAQNQHRDPAAPPAPSPPRTLSSDPPEPEYTNVLLGCEDVLYSTITITEHRGGGSLWGRPAPQEPAVTYAALPPPRLQRPPSDSYENICK